jgi:thioredoxin 1
MGFNPEYSEETLTADQVSELVGDVLIEFGTPWCGHCQAALPAVKNILQQHVDMPHIKVYDGKGKRLGRVFKVKLWPTFILLHNGQEVARLIRPTDAQEMQQLLEKRNA